MAAEIVYDPLRIRPAIETEFVRHVKNQADFQLIDRQPFTRTCQADGRQQLMALNEDSFEKRRSHIKGVIKCLKGMSAASDLMRKHSTELAEGFYAMGNDMLLNNSGTAPEMSQIMLKCAELQIMANDASNLQAKRMLRTSLIPLERIVHDIDEAEELVKRFDRKFTKLQNHKKKEKDNKENELGLDLRTCDYLLMINEMKFKTDVEVVQCTMDSTGIQALLLGEELNVSKIMESMSQTIARWRSEYITERQVLLALRHELKSALYTGVEQRKVGLSHVHGQFKGAGATSDSCKSGWVYKKSARFSGFNKRWIVVENGVLHIGPSQHNLPLQEAKPTKQIPLYTCTVKEVRTTFPKYSFTVISPSHSWTFAVMSEFSHNAWISCIRNAISEALSAGHSTSQLPDPNTAMYKLFINRTRKVMGNDACADCGDAQPEWVSLNLGILICLACSGVHRQLGVQVSVVRSLALDNLSVTDVLLTKAVGNKMSNSVYEALGIPNDISIRGKNVSMEAKVKFAQAKYVQHSFVAKQFNDRHKHGELMLAIKTSDVRALVQYVAQGFDIQESLPGLEEDGITPLHYAVMKGSVVCTAFLAAHPGTDINATTSITMSTPLHSAVKGRNLEVIKLLLSHSPDLKAVDSAGLTPAMLARNDSPWEEDREEEDDDIIENKDIQYPTGKSLGRQSMISTTYSTDTADAIVSLLTDAASNDLDECKTVLVDDWGVSATPMIQEPSSGLLNGSDEETSDALTQYTTHKTRKKSAHSLPRYSHSHKDMHKDSISTSSSGIGNHDNHSSGNEGKIGIYTHKKGSKNIYTHTPSHSSSQLPSPSDHHLSTDTETDMYRKASTGTSTGGTGFLRTHGAAPSHALRHSPSFTSVTSVGNISDALNSRRLRSLPPAHTPPTARSFYSNVKNQAKEAAKEAKPKFLKRKSTSKDLSSSMPEKNTAKHPLQAQNSAPRKSRSASSKLLQQWNLPSASGEIRPRRSSSLSRIVVVEGGVAPSLQSESNEISR